MDALATEMNLTQVRNWTYFYDEAVIDGDAGKVLFMNGGRCVRSAWLV